GAVQGQIESILADYPDGGHSDLDAAAAVVGVHNHQIGCDFIASNDVPLGHTGQHPDLASHLQRTGRLVSDALAQELVGELEGILVLHHLVAVRDDTQDAAIGVADVGLVAGNPAALVGADIPLN